MRKSERLHGKKSIQHLFTEESRSIFIFPLRLVWVFNPEKTNEPVEVLFGASKRKFRRAHERNRIKRVLREVYRKNAHLLREPLISKQKQVLLSISYVGEKDIRSEQVERIFLSIVDRFVAELN